MIPKEEAVFSFGPEMEPVLEVDPGTVVTFETHDCSSGQIATESDPVTDIVESPATKALPVRNGIVHFNGEIRFPMRPMVGGVGEARTSPTPCPANTTATSTIICTG